MHKEIYNKNQKSHILKKKSQIHAKGIDPKISNSMCFGQFSEISPGPLLPPTQPNRVKDLCVEVHCLYR